jgi:hypothetical protein
MATPQQLLAQAGRPARQDLSGAVNGTLQGAHGGTQQLGAPAMRRLAGGGVPAVPGVMPPAPSGAGDPTMPPSDSQTMPPPPGGWPGVQSITGGPDLAPPPQAGGGTSLGVNPNGYGTPSTFNLPGFKPVGWDTQLQSGGTLGVNPKPAGATPPPDPNALRQALGVSPLMMNNIARTPDVATSPFGQAPGNPEPGNMGAGYGPIIGGRPGMSPMGSAVDSLPPGFGKAPPQSGPAGVGGAAPPPRGALSPGAGGAGTPWSPLGGAGLPGFKPKKPQVEVQTGGPDLTQPPVGARVGRQNMRPNTSMGQF